MEKLMIILGFVVLAFSEIYGIPVMNEMRPTDPSIAEITKTKDWIDVYAPRSSPPILTMNRLLRSIGFNESEITRIKRRIENLERSQKEIYELMMKISQCNCHSAESSTITKVSTKTENSISSSKHEKIIDEQKSPAPTAIPTTTVLSTIQYTLNDAMKSSAPVKPVKSKTIAAVKTEQSTMMTTSIISEHNQSNLNSSDEIQGTN